MERKLELRCLRFYKKFLGNWSVSTERKHMKHTFESVSLTSFSKKEGGRASKANYILVSKSRQQLELKAQKIQSNLFLITSEDGRVL